MAKKLFSLLLICFMIAACTPRPEQIAPYVVQTIDAWPTQTPYSTQTPFPTYTSFPTLTPNSTYTPKPTYTPWVVTVTYTPTPLYTPTETSIPTATKNPLETDKSDGFYLVNVDIAPGIWRSTGQTDDCYWAITSKTGDILENHFGMAGGTMYIPSHGYQVELNDCGDWTYIGQ